MADETARPASVTPEMWMRETIHPPARPGTPAHDIARIGEIMAENERLREDVVLWRTIAMSATPGGSEYTNPDRCRAHIQELRNDLHTARCEVVRLKRQMSVCTTCGRAKGDPDGIYCSNIFHVSDTSLKDGDKADG